MLKKSLISLLTLVTIFTLAFGASVLLSATENPFVVPDSATAITAPSTVATGTYRYVSADITGDITVSGTLFLVGDYTITGTITVADGGSFYMSDGTLTGDGIISGGNVRKLFIERGGSFFMHGGTIRGNVADTNSGGVRVHTGGVFYMHDGLITGNITTSAGAGIYVDGLFNMYGGEISGNTSRNGGGVYLGNANAVFNMCGGLISNNTATDSGGGITLLSGTLVMTDGIISGNTSGLSGGGVSLQHSSVFTMYGGEISGNNNTRIPNANQQIGGGGVSITGSSAVFTMNDGTISGNTAISGGGVNNYSGTFNMNGGVITDNQAVNAGGVLIDRFSASSMTSFNMTGGTISDNTASNRGGGIWVRSHHNVIISGGYIIDNDANYGGGIYILDTGIVNISGDTVISNNTAVYNGGGIFATNFANLTISNSVVFGGNTAATLHNFYLHPDFTPGGNVAAADSGGGQGGSTANINWASVSIPGTHALNNYDINFIGYAYIPTMAMVTFLPGTNGTFANYVTYISFQVPVGTILTAANVPNVTENADWEFIGWATNPMTDPVGFVVNEDVTFVAQYESTYDGSPATGITGFVIGAIALVTLGGVMFTMVKKAGKTSV